MMEGRGKSSIAPTFSKRGYNYPKIGTISFHYRLMGPKDADGIANSVDPNQTAPLGAV